MNSKIPKIIHQIWFRKDEIIPEELIQFRHSWVKYHSDWQFIYWDEIKIKDFMSQFYPNMIAFFNELPLEIQRRDIIRYLILYNMGGLYVDYDYEALNNVSCLLTGSCNFSSEPSEHRLFYGLDVYFNNAFMAAEPGAEFMRFIIDHMEASIEDVVFENKIDYVLETTGPKMLLKRYNEFTSKESINIIDETLVSPLSKSDAVKYIQDKCNIELKKKVIDAYAMHYFSGMWI